MVQVYISHHSNEKEIALDFKNFLEQSLIACCLDKNDNGFADAPNIILYSGTGNKKAIVLLSGYYLESKDCQNDFEWVQTLGEENVIIVTTEAYETLTTVAKYIDCEPLKTALTTAPLISYFADRPLSAYDQVVMKISKFLPVTFQPLTTITLHGQALQLITLKNIQISALMDLQVWPLNLSYFISRSDTDHLPIKKDTPVAIVGDVPSWALIHLAFQFVNNQEVYIPTGNEGEYICVYARPENQQLLFTVLKA
jgi:hypothetical protein